MRPTPLVLLFAACPSGGPGGALAPLEPSLDHLEQALRTALRGEDPYRAYHPWTLSTDGDVARARQAHVQSVGVDDARVLGLEIELGLLRDGVLLADAKTRWVVGRDRRVALLDLNLARAPSQQRVAEFPRVRDLYAHTKPFADAATAVAGALGSAQCPRLGDGAEALLVASNVPLSDSELERLHEAQALLVDQCATLATLVWDEIAVHVDDVSLLALSHGHPAGLLELEIEVRPNGEVRADFPRFVAW